MIRPSGCFSARCRLSSAPLSPAVDQQDPAAGNPALGPECLSLQATNLISSQALIYSQQRLSLMISDDRECSNPTTPTNKNKIYSILHFNHFHKCGVVFQKWMSDFLSSSLFHSAISSAGLGWDSSRIPDVHPEGSWGIPRMFPGQIHKFWVSSSRPPVKVSPFMAKSSDSTCSTQHQNTSQRATVLSLQDTPTSRNQPTTQETPEYIHKTCPESQYI